MSHPCDVCGSTKHTLTDSRFGTTTCPDHSNVSPVEISRMREKQEALPSFKIDFHKRTTRKAFKEYLVSLEDYGFTREEAINLLEDIYYTVRREND